MRDQRKLMQKLKVPCRRFGPPRHADHPGIAVELAEGLGLEEPSGALVSEVTAGGPAADGGVEAGDVILKFDGKDVEEMRDLPRMVAETDVGKDVRVVVWRKGKTQTVKVVLGLLEEGETPAPAEVDKPAAPETAESALQMKLQPLTEATRGEYGVAADVKGVVVTEVAANSPAAEKGIRPGDVIVEVAQEAVATPADVRGAVAKAKEEARKSVLMLVQSGENLRFVAVKIEE